MSGQETGRAGLRDFSGKSSGVTLRDITKIFPIPQGKGETIAVNHIDLTVEDGELVTLLGPSGCGKTTTLRMISGFEYPTSGEIHIGGKDVANVPPNKRGISMVFQSYALFPHLSIWENIAYGLKVQRLPKEEVIARTSKVIELMQLGSMEKRFPNQLSGGQQQRVALARAIVIEPRVLLFDEPLSNLDAKLREHMRDELRSLQQRLGITSIYVTHDQAEAMAISDRVIIMNHGRIQQAGTPTEIYDQPTSKFVANFMGKASFMNGRIVDRQGEAIIVQVSGIRLQIPHPGNVNLRDAQDVFLIVRPESIALSKEEGHIKGVIARATYFGSKVEYEIALPDQDGIIVESFNPSLSGIFGVGEEVYLRMELPCVRAVIE